MCSSINIEAQPFPYLNASTGNAGQYIVDADTNIIMYHGNQIEKLDKNLNPIWVKTYSGLDFHSLLLSKTGSIYFISKNSTPIGTRAQIIGKLNADGSVNWCKKILSHQSSNETYINNLLLNRDNYLIASAIPKAMQNYSDTTSWLIKLDTLGQIQMSKQFKLGLSYDPIITSDSLGLYQFVGSAHAFESDHILTLNYSEISNTISNPKRQFSEGQYGQIWGGKSFISKYEPYTYYSVYFIAYYNSNWRILVQKYKHNQLLWTRTMPRTGGAFYIDGVDEDPEGNVYFTISTDHSSSNTYSWLTKVPPNNLPCQKIDYISSIGPTYPNSYISSKIQLLYENKFVHDAYGPLFPNNPLTLTLLDSTLTSNCSSSSILTSTYTTGSGGPLIPFSPQIFDYPNYYIQNLTPTVTSVANFSVNMNYCLYLGNEELEKQHGIEIYPNPVLNELNVSIKNQNESLETKIYDCKGVEILKSNSTIIKTENLSKGLYLIKVKTDKGEFSQKFIKE